MDLGLIPTKSGEETEPDTPPHTPTPSIKNHQPPAFKECMKNHAANIGGHAVDGCGEYMPMPVSLICAACGCHRNFHRRAILTPHFLNFNFGQPQRTAVKDVAGRKRSRTKFSQDQKERMHSFSEKLGWKMQRCDDAAVEEFCRHVGVARGVLKVWMHNNKNINRGNGNTFLLH
ncbi:zinc-finger homeodomain protein 9-like [Salvia hispanica]|uniref:zinc-finger homeodomain protein 9-like n=1 Tax=Salvia hispanica TaxID=49212 RepID=UPI002009D0B1|nr:zinc-finger homeodomain protein 9-like [Salvia hispanica]